MLHLDRNRNLPPNLHSMEQLNTNREGLHTPDIPLSSYIRYGFQRLIHPGAVTWELSWDGGHQWLPFDTTNSRNIEKIYQRHSKISKLDIHHDRNLSHHLEKQGSSLVEVWLCPENRKRNLRDSETEWSLSRVHGWKRENIGMIVFIPSPHSGYPTRSASPTEMLEQRLEDLPQTEPPKIHSRRPSETSCSPPSLMTAESQSRCSETSTFADSKLGKGKTDREKSEEVGAGQPRLLRMISRKSLRRENHLEPSFLDQDESNPSAKTPFVGYKPLQYTD